jgi:lysophospholipase L1-like esterase
VIVLRRSGLFASVVLWLALLAACSDSPTQPTTLTIDCPDDVVEPLREGLAVTVDFPIPTTSGGTAPVRVSCSPASGSSFPLGNTSVLCTATDANQRSAFCSFTVQVTAPPYVRFTKYVAFGDSITEGQDGTAATSLDISGPRVIVPPDQAYPGRLRQLLSDRYVAQIFPAADSTYMNQGRGGEATSGGLLRLPGVLSSLRPQALLLMEGANDISGGDPAAIPRAEDNLRAMVRLAQSRGVQVVLATLPPQNPSGPRAGGAALVEPLNNEIRALARENAAFLADVHAAFGGDLSLISPDGLHPTEAGFHRIAETFFEVIRDNFEIPYPGGGGTGAE